MPTIRFEGVSKLFRQRHAHAPDSNLWVLRDISFECSEGEVLGVIGRNGCGKSTLLKLAANVTRPTTGKVERVLPVAPMLELGAGFHHDLTGRDNIRLNGSFLGLGRNMAPALLDEIVAFAELEQHVDTPVKHYSSGMYARLGFAIAVHSPARLLLVDEVLGVGDRPFRERCLARMKLLCQQGATVILVSHDAALIRSFCNRAILLENGRAIADGRPEETLQAYDWRLRGLPAERPTGVDITQVEILDSAGAPLDGVLHGAPLRISVHYDASGTSARWQLVAKVRREDGVYCTRCASEESGDSEFASESAAGSAVVELDDLHLVSGRYVVEVSIEDAESFMPLTTRASQPFLVPGPFFRSHKYEAVVEVKHRWNFR